MFITWRHAVLDNVVVGIKVGGRGSSLELESFERFLIRFPVHVADRGCALQLHVALRVKVLLAGHESETQSLGMKTIAGVLNRVGDQQLCGGLCVKARAKSMENLQVLAYEWQAIFQCFFEKTGPVK